MLQFVQLDNNTAVDGSGGAVAFVNVASPTLDDSLIQVQLSTMRGNIARGMFSSDNMRSSQSPSRRL